VRPRGRKPTNRRARRQVAPGVRGGAEAFSKTKVVLLPPLQPVSGLDEQAGVDPRYNSFNVIAGDLVVSVEILGSEPADPGEQLVIEKRIAKAAVRQLKSALAAALPQASGFFRHSVRIDPVPSRRGRITARKPLSYDSVRVGTTRGGSSSDGPSRSCRSRSLAVLPASLHRVRASRYAW
jgi:hypothetical protein